MSQRGPRPPSSEGSALAKIALIAAVLTLLLGYVGQAYALASGRPPAPPVTDFFRVVFASRSFAEFTSMLVGAGKLLAFDQPTPTPQNAWFAAARLVGFGFSLTAGAGVSFALFKSWPTSLKRKWIGWKSRRPGRRHVVIFGLGGTGIALVKEIRRGAAPALFPDLARARDVIAVDVDPGESEVEAARDLHACVLLADANEERTLERTMLDRAQAAFICCGDDALNLDIAGRIRESLEHAAEGHARRRRALDCWIHVGDPAFSDMLGRHGLPENGGDDVAFHIFNTWRDGAHELLLDHDFGLATTFVPGDDEVPHYTIFGFGTMGQTVAVEIARICHFTRGVRPRITILDDFEGDPAVARAKRRFLSLHPGFCPAGGVDLRAHIDAADPQRDEWSYRGYRVEQAARVERREAIEYVAHAEFLSLPSAVVSDEAVGEIRARWRSAADIGVKPALIACFEDDRRNAETALRLGAALVDAFEDADRAVTPICAYLPREGGLASLVSDVTLGPFLPIVCFGGRDWHVTGYWTVTRPLIEDVARMLNLSYRRHVAGRTGPEADPASAAQRAWRSLSPWEKESNRAAARHALVKLRALDVELSRRPPEAGTPSIDIEPLARMEHHRWCAEALLTGWRYEPAPEGYEGLAPERQDAVREQLTRRRRRWSLVPWEGHLSEDDRDRDRAQIRDLIWAIENAGFYVVPASTEGPRPRR